MAIRTEVITQIDGSPVGGYSWDTNSGAVVNIAIFIPEGKRDIYFALIKNGTGERFEVPDSLGNYAIDVHTKGLFHHYQGGDSNFGCEGGTS